MKPMIILPPDTMSEADIKTLRDNDICVVVAKDPAIVRFVDPIPAVSSRTQIENAAIQLSRKLLTGKDLNPEWFKNRQADFATLFVELVVQGTPLDASPSQQEREQEAYNCARIDEMRALARQEARAEKAAKKSAQLTTAKP